MNVLIAYASGSGTTKECATNLADKLKGKIALIDLQKQTVSDLTAYDAVVIGSNVRIGKIHKSVKKFCQAYEKELAEKSHGFFLCCGSPETADAYYKNNFSPVLLEGALSLSCLGGEMDPQKLTGLPKWILNMAVKAAQKDGKPLPVLLPGELDALAEKINSIA